MMETSRQDVTAKELKGKASGALFMLFFGAFWIFSAMFYWQGLPRWSIIAVSLIPISLAALAVRQLRRASGILPEVSARERAQGASIGRKFRIIFSTEGALIGLAVMLLVRFAHPELIPVAVALIVGLHFLPLAHLFRSRLYYWVGSLIVAMACACLLIKDAQARLVALGFGVGLLLWFTSALMLWTSGGFTGKSA
jgi:uncharacterized protein DUF7010